jgi:YbbR domain-containing protein
MVKSRILKNPGLKAVSLVLAFIVWLIIMNISDPVRKVTITGIPVQFTNVAYIESKGLSYEVASGFETISVSVMANRSTIEKLNAQNITATADLTQVIDFDTDPVMVPVSVNVPGVQKDDVTVLPRNIQIILEEMTSRDFVINTTSGDTVPANGYEVGDLSASVEQLTIRGSKSLVDSIDKVTAEVDVTDLTTDSDITSTLHIYDKNGSELSDTQKSYLTFSVDPGQISVHVTLYSVVSNVSLTALTYGTPASGYQVGSITLTPSEISVVGNEEALSAFNASGHSITIDAESQAIDVSGAKTDVTAKVDINNYLPDGIRLASGLSNTVVAQVTILPYGSKAFVIDTRDVTKNNLAEGLNAVFVSPDLDLKVRGSSEQLESLMTDDIKASVDLSGKTSGTYDVPVTITLPSGYSLVEDVTASITISETTTAGG